MLVDTATGTKLAIISNPQRNSKPVAKTSKTKNVTIKKGKTAYGCANFGTCGFKIPFGLLNKKLTDKQVVNLILSGKTAKIKGLEMPGSEKSFEGKFVLTGDFEIEIEK